MFWSWSGIVAIYVYKWFSSRSRLVFLGSLCLVLTFSFFQLKLNSIVTRTEIRTPSPYGLDILRALEKENYLSPTMRCKSLLPIQEKFGDSFIEQLNNEFSKRHNKIFCQN